MTFQCLGDWEDSNGNSFMALLDTEASDEKRPRYRCAVSTSVRCFPLLIHLSESDVYHSHKRVPNRVETVDIHR